MQRFVARNYFELSEDLACERLFQHEYQHLLAPLNGAQNSSNSSNFGPGEVVSPLEGRRVGKSRQAATRMPHTPQQDLLPSLRIQDALVRRGLSIERDAEAQYVAGRVLTRRGSGGLVRP